MESLGAYLFAGAFRFLGTARAWRLARKRRRAPTS
jgi:hypothetical protein